MLTFVDVSSVKLNSLLDTTGYTNEYILQKLYENNSTFVKQLGNDKVVKISAYDISEGKGYCSRVFKTTIHFGDDTKEPYAFILKIPTDDAWDKLIDGMTEDEKDNNKGMIRKMHNAECDAYELINGLEGFPAPEVYYIERSSQNQSGMIMMNDLSQKGLSLGIFFSVTEQQCFNLARHVADFQVYVDFMPGKPWKSKFKDNMNENQDMDELCRKLMLPICEYKEDPELVNNVNVFLRINTAKLGRYATSDRAGEIGCKTVVHGDMWTNNMLIGKSEDDSTSDQILAIIDWQTVFEGNPLSDIARFITNCADAEIRREHESELVDFYYECLTKKYKEHGSEPNFTKEQAHELYELGLVQQCGLIFIMFALIALPLKDSKDGADKARLKKLALRSNLLFEDTDVIMKKYNMYELFKL